MTAASASASRAVPRSTASASVPTTVPLGFAITGSPGPRLGARDPEGNDALETLARDGMNQVRLPRIEHEQLEGLTPGRGALPDTLRAVQDQLDWTLRATQATGQPMYVAVNLGELSVLTPGTARARWLDYVVERYRDHPALGVWKFLDEPNNPYTPNERIPGIRRAWSTNR